MYIERRDKQNNLFHELQESSLEMIRQWSGEIWTDYNAHDPGITIMEHLHYALYELDYVYEASFADYLRDETGTVDYPAHGLLPVAELFAPAVVTTADYERLIAETIPEVKRCRVTIDAQSHYTLYIELHAGDESDIAARVERLYHAHRNLCETLAEVIVVPHLPGDEACPPSECPTCKPGHQPPRPRYNAPPVYTSIQHDFPDNYGINRRGKPPRLAPEQEARIRQLQGYLLIFDYLLADAYRQASHASQMLSFTADIPPAEIPPVDIEDLETLVDRQRMEEVTLQDDEWLHRQKARYLDMLDTLYGEDTSFLTAGNQQEKNRKRIDLIRRLPQLNTRRFRSFDMRDATATDIPAVKHTVAALLDYDPAEETPLTDLYSRYHHRQNNVRGSFHLVEHLLLTAATGETEATAERHTLSIVLPSWDKHYRQRPRYEQLLTERLPAHLTLRFLWLDAREMHRFETLYYAWRKALPGNQPRTTLAAAQALRQYIHHLQPSRT